MTALRALERFTRRRRAGAGTRCELCLAPVSEPHRHVVDVIERRMLCACHACALLFAYPSHRAEERPSPSAKSASSPLAQTHARYRTVPDRVVEDPTSTIEPEDLRALGVPIGLAFFFKSRTLGRRTGVFPSPAGATEAEIEEQAWAAVLGRCALAREVEDDIEALLVRHPREGRGVTLLVPIDACYELTALLRRRWRGFDGGDDARDALDAFLARLSERAEPLLGGAA